MLGIYVAYFILCLIAIFVISGSAEAWIRRHATDYTEGDWPAPAGWCHWGRITPLDGDEPVIRYAFLRLPSYEWRWHWLKHEECWHQRVIWWSSYRGWSLQSWPCDR